MSMDNAEDLWKEKAIARRIENKELKKRRKELVGSRNNWKRKYMEEKQRADLLEQELSTIKKKLNAIINK